MYPGITPSLTLTVLLTSAAVWTSTLTGCPKHAKFKPETSALESLECRNDYSTHIHCSWMGDTHIPLYLFHMDPDDHRVSPCIQTPNPSKNPAGQKRVSCHYNTSLFAIGFDDVFFFNTPHSPGLSKTFRLTKYDDAESHWIFTQLDDTPPLSHSTPGHLMTLLTTDPLRRHDQHRPEVVINQETLKGKREVKIHTNPVQKLEMEGSANKMEETEVLFNGPALTSDYSLPGPCNLHCVLNGGWNVSCSWEMTHDLAQYICYTLTYRTHSSALSEWFCVEKVEVINVGDLLRMVGVLTVFEPGLLQVQLTPTPVSRVIRAYENIQPTCPMGLSVELREDWILKWTLPKYRTVPLTAELKYWSILTPEDVKTIFLSDAIMVYAISERTLRGSTEYWAQVRCNVSTHRRSGRRYAGYPSEWTNLVHWTTRPEPLAPRVVAFFLYFLIVTLAAAVSITVFFILVTIQRRLREWDVSLPSPLHSKASEVPLCLQRERLPCCTEFKDPDISDAQIVGVRLQFPSIDSGYTSTADGDNHCQQSLTEGNALNLLVNNPCPMSARTALPQCDMRMNVLHCDSTVQTHPANIRDVVLPCSGGYLENPATSCHLNVEMDDRYMNCPGPDLISPKRKTNTHSLHTQQDLNNVFRPPSLLFKEVLQEDSEWYI